MPSGTDPGAGDRAALFGATCATACLSAIELFVAGSPNRRSRSLRPHP
ncbi:hypothetical protein MKK67_18665 [Methylobacterium sp. J-072]|nr:hypothetical protein [Methylobacterium sp. J-072]MCJ2094498.1 hypothetical protein [Methylobacterium sp. J-072]